MLLIISVHADGYPYAKVFSIQVTIPHSNMQNISDSGIMTMNIP